MDIEIESGIEASLARWCQRHLGSTPTDLFFHHHHLTEAHGLRLADGREVVLKTREASPRVAGCALVQRVLSERGFPCPQLFAGPEPLSEQQPDLMVSAEEWVPGGEIRLGPDAPREYAVLLAQMVAAAPPAEAVPSLDPPVPWMNFDHGEPDRIWPPAFSPRWDPHRIESQLPALVVDVAERSRRRLLADDARGLCDVVAHGDFEAQNMRWFADETSPGRWRPVVHDWDSVVAMPECIVVGAAAAGFVSPDQPDLAGMGESEAFLAAYQAERGRDFSAWETQLGYAAGLWVAAYNAAFEHLKGGPGPVTAQLQLQAPVRLQRAGA